MRITVAAVLGFLAFCLMASFGAGRNSNWAALSAGLGAFFLLSMYVLSRGAPDRGTRGWVLLALNAALLLFNVISMLTDAPASAVRRQLALAGVGVVGSLAGWALAAWTDGRSPRGLPGERR
jgi:hypothetical protein